MPLESVHEIIRKAETNYLQGTTRLGKYVTWSMHDTIERIDAYLNSKHISGEVDSLGRPKPFFNIVSAIVNIWYRATDIDRKDIKFIPTNSSSVVLAFVANVMLQNWMDKNRFGQFLNEWGRSLARYGSAIPKFVEQGSELKPSIVPWNRYIADPVQFDALPRIEKFYLTPAQLRKVSQYDQTVVDQIISARNTRTTLDRAQKDTMNDFIELYEVHGELDSRLLDDSPDVNKEQKDIKYIQQMHVVSYVQKGGKAGTKGEFDDFTLYKGREAKDPYFKTDLIQEDGRTLAIGAVEYAFEAQWMMNHTVKNMKDSLDLASKQIMQTADANFVGRNVLTAIEVGEIMVTAENKPLTRVANDNPSIAALQNYGAMWQTMVRDLTSTPDALRGSTLPSGTPYALGQLLSEQGGNLFEIMTENKGLALEDMLRTYVIPFLRKQLKNKDEVVAILDGAGIQEIDSMYIPTEAVNRHNKQFKNNLLNGAVPSPYQPAQAQQQVQESLASSGDKRFFKPDEMDEMTWAELFSDFEWDSVRVQITNENQDKKAVLSTLNTLFTTVSNNPLILNNPDARILFNAILGETGVISPMQISGGQTLPPPRPSVRVTERVDYKDLPPEAQQQMLANSGIQVQPQSTPTPDTSQPIPLGGGPAH